MPKNKIKNKKKYKEKEKEEEEGEEEEEDKGKEGEEEIPAKRTGLYWKWKPESLDFTNGNNFVCTSLWAK